MSRFSTLCLSALAFAALAGCTPDYSPNTYSANAVQQANKVERAIVIGFRQVEIRANGTVGAVTGGAAGGILGAQAGDTTVTTALGTVGGSLVGGVVGTFIEHVTGDTTGWEYIVQKPDKELLSVTQREPQPLPIGQKVLVITGNQARVIADYSTSVDAAPVAPPPGSEKPAAEKLAIKPSPEGTAAATAPPASSSAATPPTSTPSETLPSAPSAPAPSAAAASEAPAPPTPSPAPAPASTDAKTAPEGSSQPTPLPTPAPEDDKAPVP